MPANPCSSSSSVVDVFFPSPFVVFGDFVVHLLISSAPLRSQREDIFFNPVDCKSCPKNSSFHHFRAEGDNQAIARSKGLEAHEEISAVLFSNLCFICDLCGFVAKIHFPIRHSGRRKSHDFRYGKGDSIPLFLRGLRVLHSS